MEAMCGVVANPVTRMWNGLGQNPHFVSIRKNLLFCEGFMGMERDRIGGKVLWKQCADSLLIQWHGCGMD